VISRHEFQLTAKKFRAGRISLDEFTEAVFDDDSADAADPASDVEFESAQSDSGAQLDAESDAADIARLLAFPDRPEDAHKGQVGRVLVIAGSSGMAGAAGLCSIAALRSGAGLVTCATPECVQPTVAGFEPSVMVRGVASSSGQFDKSALKQLQELAAGADVIAIGPGMGRTRAGQKIVQTLYEDFEQPMVVDADGLNNLAGAGVDWGDHAGPRVLTPHPGEFQRLTGVEINDRATLEMEAVEMARECELTLLLKGHRSLVTDGTDVYRNATGNAGMATAGAGDVLTGMIAALIAQGLSPRDAAVSATYVHGLAGDLAAEMLGQIGMIASDLLNFLPHAYLTMQQCHVETT